MPKKPAPDAELIRLALTGIDAEIQTLQSRINALQEMKKQYSGAGGGRTAAAPASAATAPGDRRMTPEARDKVGASVSERWARARSLGLKSLSELAAWEKSQEGKGTRAKKAAKAGKAAKGRKAARAKKESKAQPAQTA
ncbi:MAG TPA: hypothetical protein VNQ79_09270 [Blastocatellia bacterium]|nr:hypothetical protein [Blastocatellia bacterium]